MAGAEQKIINVKIKGVKDLLKLREELKKLKKEQAKVTSVNKKSEKEWIDKERAIDKATKKYKQNRRELTKLNKEQRKGAQGSKGFAKGMVKMAAGIGLAVVAFRAISRVVTKAFSTFTDFEFSMAKVRAISGATTDEFYKLTASAKELGRTTFFTAKEVAELQVNFSKLGFTATQIMELQGATLDLAMATGSDLARSAMVAGSAVRGFNLDASEAGRVVDVMAVAFTNSALDIEKWQTSMTKVSSIAANVGIDIEGTAATMGVLSDAGIEASIGGTSLRNIFLKMANPTSDLAKRIGFVVNSTDDMIRALKSLNKAQLSQLELQGLVDVRQVIAFQRMIDGVTTIEEYTEALRDSNGAGREMSQIMEDSTKGAFKRFTSALEGLFIVFSEKIAPIVNKVTKSLTKFIGKISKASEIRISSKWRKDAIAMNNIFKAVSDTNNSMDTRNELLKRINRRYGDYLDNELQDITNTNDLADAQAKLNSMYVEKIALQIAEEDITDHIRRGKEMILELADVEEKIRIAEAKMGESLGETTHRLREAALKKGNKFDEEWANAIANFGFLGEGAKWIDRVGRQYVNLIVNTFREFGETKDLANLLERQIELRAEEVARPEAMDKLKAAYKDAQGDFDKFVANLRKSGKVKVEHGCIEGVEYWDGDKCVPIVATIDPAKLIAIKKKELMIDARGDKAMLKAKTMKMEEFIKNEENRAQALFDYKEDLAKKEMIQYQGDSTKKEIFYVKYLKAIEAADKNRTQTSIDRMKRRHDEEKRKLEETLLYTGHSRLEADKKRLELEKKHLGELLEENKNYFTKWLAIQKKMEKVEKELGDNKKEMGKELLSFGLELAQEFSNAASQILTNNLEQEMTARQASIDKQFDATMYGLDRRLAQKSITEADYAMEKRAADMKQEALTTKLQKEAAIKRRRIARAEAIINGAVAITAAWTSPYTAPFIIPMIVGTTMAQLAVIESTQFKKGGMIDGKSHEQGGEKFAVGGRVVELEGGEAVINRRSSAMFRPALSAMNQAGGGVKFADGGLLNMGSFAAARFNSAMFNQPSGGGKVVVVESDITTSQTKVKTIQSNASF